MTRLIDTAEHNRRRLEARRASGVMPREEYEALAAERQRRAHSLREGGLSWVEVAERVGAPNAEATRQLALRGHRQDRTGLAYIYPPTSRF
jgi:hypothetical protein